MNLQIKSSNLNLDGAREGLLQKKLGHISEIGRFFDAAAARVEVRVEHGKPKRGADFVRIEAVAHLPAGEFRAEGKAENFETALDRAESRLTRQISRLKGRLLRENRREKITDFLPGVEPDAETPEIFRRKRYSATAPLSELAAVARMNEIGHDFFLFENADTGRFAMMYRRDGGGYGLVEPRLPGDEKS